jgi:exodeoxyribonuclease VII small subunit
VSPKPVPAPEPSFEESLARLEAIVRELSRGEIPLDRSLQAFEEGSALVKACLEKLAAAEESVQKLLARADGTFETTAMDEPADDADDAGAR